MKRKRLLAQILALSLCLVLLCPLSAYAEGEESAAPPEPESYGVLDPAAMTKLVEDYMAAFSYNKDKISVGYCFLDTGDTWYYNADRWYFSAGLHKVPVMMILAEREHEGELTRDSEIKGMSLAEAEESVLVYSSNETTHAMMSYIGTDQECRLKYRNFSALPEEYYDPDYLEYSYFSARFTTDVIKTLYYESERFPNILECMKRSDDGAYFDAGLNGECEVAQKYGTFTDKRGVEFNHDAAVIYTPHPFALVVMTQDLGVNQQVLKDMAIIFRDYTLTLDEAYAAWEKAQSEPGPVPGTPAPAPAEPVEENPFLEEEPAEEPDASPAAPEAGEGEESGEDAVVETAPTPSAERERNARIIVLLLNGALLVILILSAVLKLAMKRKRRRQA